MSKTPNILECDGLIIRGPNGKKRAEIQVDESSSRGSMVVLHMYGDTDTEIPEPAVTMYVDGQGEAHFCFAYAGVDEQGEVHPRAAVQGRSGTDERPPRLEYFGRRGGSFHHGPTFVLDGENLGRRSDFVDAVLEAAKRCGVGEEDPSELMQDVAAVLQAEQEAVPVEMAGRAVLLRRASRRRPEARPLSPAAVATRSVRETSRRSRGGSPRGRIAATTRDSGSGTSDSH